jgi:uncharacterized membrane protein YdbT with pleckstrin-like domain
MSIKSEWSGTRSWWNYFGRLGGAALLAISAGAFQLTEWEQKAIAGIILIAFALALFLSACWSKFSDRFRVANGTVSATYGLLSQETHEIEIRDIKDIVLKQSLLGRVLGYGTLEFSSAGRDTAEVTFEGIPRAKAIKDLVSRLKRETVSVISNQ